MISVANILEALQNAADNGQPQWDENPEFLAEELADCFGEPVDSVLIDQALKARKIESLGFGESVFFVKSRLSIQPRNKITMLDENGVTWYRYDGSTWEYEIIELVYCGRIDFVAKGETSLENPEEYPELYFKRSDGRIDSYLYDDLQHCFFTRKHAEERVAYLKTLEV